MLWRMKEVVRRLQLFSRDSALLAIWGGGLVPIFTQSRMVIRSFSKYYM